MDLIGFLQAGTGAFVAATFLLALLVGSFLNVVIYRLPLILERQWQEQCAELAGQPSPPGATLSLGSPRSYCPAQPASDSRRARIGTNRQPDTETILPARGGMRIDEGVRSERRRRDRVGQGFRRQGKKSRLSAKPGKSRSSAKRSRQKKAARRK